MKSTRYRQSASAFTLVELLVVIGIIAAPDLDPTAGTRQGARTGEQDQVRSNLRSLGQSILMFAGDHKGRVPLGTTRRGVDRGGAPGCSSMITSSWSTIMVRIRRLFTCPMNVPDHGGSAVFFKPAPRRGATQMNSLYSAGPSYYGASPDNPTFNSSQWGTGGLHKHWAQIGYSYMGANVQTPNGASPKWGCTSLTRKTTTGDNDIDTNPPLMGDTTIYQPSTGYHRNHGRVEGGGSTPTAPCSSTRATSSSTCSTATATSRRSRRIERRTSGPATAISSARPLLGILIPGTAYA